ncbi:MAG: DUF58 domain-containing protein [Phycisphaerae bacterium]
MSDRKEKIFDAGFHRRLKGLELMARRIAEGTPGGQRRSRRIGDGLEFADHRDYSPGDDVRFVDWPYYARMEKLLIRLFHRQGDSRVTILLDVSGSMGPAGADDRKFIYALQTAAALGAIAMGAMDRLEVLALPAEGPGLSVGRGQARLGALLEMLASLAPAGPTDLLDPVSRWARTRHETTHCLLISDLLEQGEAMGPLLRRLSAARCPSTVIHLYSPEDASPQARGPVQLQCAESGQELKLDASEQLVEAYRAAWRQWAGSMERLATTAGADYVRAPCDVPFEKLVLGTLRRSGVIRR